MENRLTVSQAAAALGKSERTIRRQCETGKLAATQEPAEHGVHWMIEEEAVENAKSPARALSAKNAQLQKVESEVQEIKSFLAGQFAQPQNVRDEVRSGIADAMRPLFDRIKTLEEENENLRTEMAAMRADDRKGFLARLLRGRNAQRPPSE
jgi:DNA repair exonuclease SbcCD ATPase subunit